MFQGQAFNQSNQGKMGPLKTMQYYSQTEHRDALLISKENTPSC